MNTTTPRRLTAALAAMVLVLAACGDDDDDDDGGGDGEIEGYAYTATEVEGQTLAEGSTLVVTIADGNVSAVGGCNTMSGSYELDGDTLVAGPWPRPRWRAPTT